MLTHSMVEWIAAYGPVAIFALLTLGVIGLPVPDEVLMLFVGSLIYSGKIGVVPAAASALGGAVVGITGSYFIGRLTGDFLMKYGKYVRITPARIEKAHAWFERAGKWLLVFGYFIPGVRHLTAYVAGAARLHFGAFALFAYGGAVFWVGTFLTLGYVLGDRWKHLAHHLHGHTEIVLLLLALALAVGWLIYRVAQRRKPGPVQEGGVS